MPYCGHNASFCICEKFVNFERIFLYEPCGQFCSSSQVLIIDHCYSVTRDENEPATITDPDATKPDGWLDDEPRLVPDPDAAKPDDWSV